MKMLVISSCTGKKIHNPINQLTLTLQDFQSTDRDKKDAKEAQLLPYQEKAIDMYTGEQHVRLRRGIELSRQEFDLWIVSAGYGIIPHHKPISPYECTFDSMKTKEIDQWARALEIPETFRTILPQYACGVVLLGKKYLRALQLQKMERFPIPLVFLCADAKELNGCNAKACIAGVQEAKDFHCGLVGLKGEIFKRLAQDGNWENFFLEPQQALDRLRYSKADLPSIKLVYEPPQRWEIEYTPRTDTKMMYFIPEWDDLVDPRYDFINDLHCSEKAGIDHDSRRDDYYAHELMGQYNYDGILVSKVIVESSKKKKADIEKIGIHKYLRCPKNVPIMGDCGAFGYIDEKEPPYKTQEIIEYYEKLGFNFGVTIDHLIVDGVCQKTTHLAEQAEGGYEEITEAQYKELSQNESYRIGKTKKNTGDLFDNQLSLIKKEEFDLNEAKRRWNITLQNGLEFLRLYDQGNYRFTPIAACQGWDPASYTAMFQQYQEAGYNYIALGSLVRSTTKDIVEILRSIDKIRYKNVKIHLFGIGRLNATKEFLELGVSSCDSASHLRRAWLGSGSNYWATTEKTYAAIRIPPVSGHNARIKKMIRDGKGTLEKFEQLETAARKALWDFDKGLIGVEETLRHLLVYDNLVGDDRQSHEKLYREALEDAPWRKCQCPVCKKDGIEVIVFRRNNRNRRRGFHNTFVFYEGFKKLTE